MVWYHPQYTEYEVSIDSKVVCLWFTNSCVFAAELNLKQNISKYAQIWHMLRSHPQ
jgi:hypothetical protein